MAKGKPNLAFLEALKQDKRRRGDSTPGGGFKTPDWFGKSGAAPKQETKSPLAGLVPAGASGRKGFKLTYMHISVGGVAVLLIAGVAFVAGRRQEQPPKLSASIEDIRSTPAQAGVMEVGTAPASTASPAQTGRVATAARPAAPAPIAVPSQALAAATPANDVTPHPPTGNIATSSSSARTVGMRYVVFQSYKDEKLATEARDALVAGGIGATVEKGLDYAPTWYVVVGTQGFASTTSPEYRQYLNKTRVISEKFAGKSKWKLFEPNPYTWKGK